MTKNWHQIDDFSFQVSQLGFTFFSNNFFFKIANDAVQQLTSAGIMQWIIDGRVGVKIKFENLSQPTKLTVNSLSFGFIIWLGFCGFSLAAFFGEIIFAILKRKVEICCKGRMQKVKIAKKLNLMKRQLKNPLNVETITKP